MDAMALKLSAILNSFYRQAQDSGIKLPKDISVQCNKGYGEDDPYLVSYSIGSYGDTDRVMGADLNECIREYMRRKGWTEANKPMTLISNDTENTDA